MWAARSTASRLPKNFRCKRVAGAGKARILFTSPACYSAVMTGEVDLLLEELKARVREMAGSLKNGLESTAIFGFRAADALSKRRN